MALKFDLLWFHIYFTSWHSLIVIMLWIYTHLHPTTITSGICIRICKKREDLSKIKLFQTLPGRMVFVWGINTFKGAQNTPVKTLSLASLLVPYPPRNISVQIVPVNRNNWEEHSGNFAEESFMGPQEIIRKVSHPPDSLAEMPAANTSATWLDEPSNRTEYETTSQPSWWSNEAESSQGEEEFVSAVSRDDGGSDASRPTAEPPPFLPVQMVLTWLPPKPPTAFDGFHINIQREGKAEPCVLLFYDSIGGCLLYKLLIICASDGFVRSHVFLE